jgi:hypothetical protein
MPTKPEIKLQFLRKCASMGLTSGQILQAATALKNAIEKQAAEDAGWASYLNPLSYVKSIADTGKSVVDFSGSAAKNVGTWGIAAPMGLAAGVGIGTGHLLAKATSPQQTAEEVKAQEVADTYRQYADHLRQQAQLAKDQQSKRVRPPSFR